LYIIKRNRDLQVKNPDRNKETDQSGAKVSNKCKSS